MNIDKFDEVQRLKAERDGVLQLLRGLDKEPLNECSLRSAGGEVDVLGSMPMDMILQALKNGAQKALVKINEQLAMRGVSVPAFKVETPDPLSDRRDLDMYVNAWVRELGGRLRPKTHLIDALVLTTRALRKTSTVEGFEMAITCLRANGHHAAGDYLVTHLQELKARP